MTKDIKVLNFGSLNIDNVYSVPHFVQAKETLASTELNIFCGGKGLNQSVALSRAKCDVYHAGAVGKEDGEILINFLKSSGVNCDYILQKDMKSGHTIIQVDKRGQNCILLYGGSNKSISKEDVDAIMENFSEGDYCILQNEINQTGYIIKKAHEKGMVIVLNPSPIDENLLEYDIDLVDYLVLNEVEACGLAGKESTDNYELLNIIADKYPNARIVLTLGEEGAIYRYKDTEIKQPIFEVPVVDTTAAGDTFTGFFIGAIIRGYDEKKALEIASKASSIAVSRKGAAPSIPLFEEVVGK
nr:ribokinase [Herbinix luporum]